MEEIMALSSSGTRHIYQKNLIFLQPHLKKFPLLKAPPRVMIIETISLYELKFVVIVKYVVLPGDRWQGRNGQLNVMFGR